MITLWTIQPVSFMKQLEVEGSIAGCFQNIDSDVSVPYNWMARQLCDRGKSTGQICPIWLWYAYGGRRKPPDLRHSWHLPRGERGLRIEFELDERQVLLSQFEMWVWVLEGQYVPENASEAQHVDIWARKGELTEKKIRHSWTRIFDLTFGCERFWGAFAGRDIQATTPSVKIDSVRRVDYFTAR